MTQDWHFTFNQFLMAYTCNPSPSGGRDQEDHNLKPAQANSLRDPILKKPHHIKRTGGMAQGKGSEFKPQYQKKERKKEMRVNYAGIEGYRRKTTGCRSSYS
jgi:hypothetical protein